MEKARGELGWKLLGFVPSTAALLSSRAVPDAATGIVEASRTVPSPLRELAKAIGAASSSPPRSSSSPPAQLVLTASEQLGKLTRGHGNASLVEFAVSFAASPLGGAWAKYRDDSGLAWNDNPPSCGWVAPLGLEQVRLPAPTVSEALRCLVWFLGFSAPSLPVLPSAHGPPVEAVDPSCRPQLYDIAAAPKAALSSSSALVSSFPCFLAGYLEVRPSDVPAGDPATTAEARGILPGAWALYRVKAALPWTLVVATPDSSVPGPALARLERQLQWASQGNDGAAAIPHAVEVPSSISSSLWLLDLCSSSRESAARWLDEVCAKNSARRR